jgi:hypothetical protein
MIANRPAWSNDLGLPKAVVYFRLLATRDLLPVGPEDRLAARRL